MSEFYDSSKRFVKLIQSRPWLFTDVPYITAEYYVKHFEKWQEHEFHIFPTMLPYRPEILDHYKDNLYQSLFLSTGPNSLGLHTIIQMSPTLHIVFVWGNSSDNKETALYATLHCADPAEFVKFLNETDRFVYNDSGLRGGFGAMS